MKIYLEFLRSKIVLASETGFTLPPEEINPALKPHQRDAVLWALRGGRRALFESFGLGKTVQELEFCHQAVRHEGGKALIVLPLGVRQEFTRDAVELLHYAAPEYITTMAEADSAAGDILPDVSAEISGREVQVGFHGDTIAQPVQGADPLRRVSGDHGHGTGSDTVFPAGQHQG